MSSVRSAALLVCFSLLLTAVVRCIAPKGLSEQLMRTVCALFMLAVLVQAVRGIGGIFSAKPASPPQDETALLEVVRRQEMSESERAVQEYIAGLLRAAGAPYRSVYVQMDNTDGTCIRCKEINVSAAGEPACRLIRSVLEGAFPGTSIEVENHDG